MTATHEVRNQVPELVGHNPADDQVLLEGLHREGAGWAEGAVRELGETIGQAHVQDWARQANDNPPTLHTHDRYGHRVDRVEFHPAWHELMRLSIGAGLTGEGWRTERPGGHVLRAAKHYLVTQLEAGHTCPIDMGYSVVPLLRREPELAARYEPLLGSREYDPADVPALGKRGILAGMSLTEKQGGSDLRANTTRAKPLGARGVGQAYELTGHKWFCSAPMCDGFYTLAYTEDGPTCFLVPRALPDGTRNPFFLQRLKDKLGNRSNASSEVEFATAFAWRVGEEGRGVRTIIQMVQLTRLDCAIASAGLIRMALVQALHHARHRIVFQKRLVDQPMMAGVLADMALEAEAAIALVMRLCRSFDLAAGDPGEAARARLLTPAIKFWVCKRAPAFVYEAMECLGGNGYVEDGLLPRLYREAPVNAIWEGSGNVMALDVLRAATPEVVQTVLDALADEAHGLPGVRETRALIGEALAAGEARARLAVERLALLAAAAALRGSAPAAVAELFARTRLVAPPGAMLGTSDINAAEIDALLARALPM